MIKIKENPNNGNGFDTVHTFENWKVAFITCAPQYGELKELKRHMLTDEVFVLVDGRATIYTLEKEKLVQTRMEKGKLYVVEKATWHHVQVSSDALLAVVENRDTCKENTERRQFVLGNEKE
jgi:mannose-6-phosphate isomerase-like protein (cupin superfamily)